MTRIWGVLFARIARSSVSIVANFAATHRLAHMRRLSQEASSASKNASACGGISTPLLSIGAFSHKEDIFFLSV